MATITAATTSPTRTFEVRLSIEDKCSAEYIEGFLKNPNFLDTEVGGRDPQPEQPTYDDYYEDH